MCGGELLDVGAFEEVGAEEEAVRARRVLLGVQLQLFTHGALMEARDSTTGGKKKKKKCGNSRRGY